MTEPTNEDLDAIQPEPHLTFTDKVIILDHGCTLLSRMVTNIDNADGQMVLYKPVELVQLDGDHMYMTPWIPMTSDDYIVVMENRAIAITEPIPNMLMEYHKQIGILKPEDCPPPNSLIH